jgi:fatty acid desaturase
MNNIEEKLSFSEKLARAMPLSFELMFTTGAALLLCLIFAGKPTTVIIPWTALGLWTLLVLVFNIFDFFIPHRTENKWPYVCCRLLTTCIFALLFGGLILLISRS